MFYTLQTPLRDTLVIRYWSFISYLHKFTSNTDMDTFISLIHLTRMFLDSGRKLEHPEDTRTDKGRTCNLNTEKTLLFWDDIATHLAIVLYTMHNTVHCSAGPKPRYNWESCVKTKSIKWSWSSVVISIGNSWIDQEKNSCNMVSILITFLKNTVRAVKSKTVEEKVCYWSIIRQHTWINGSQRSFLIILQQYL